MIASHEQVSGPVVTTTVGVVGLGLMGSRIASALLAAGHSVAVWNRSPAKADALVAQGARAFATATEVLESSDITLIVLSDYLSVREVLNSLPPASGPKPVVVNLTTGDSAGAAELHAEFGGRVVDYLDGAILSYPKDIGTSAAIVVAGNSSVWDEFGDILRALGEGTAFVGEDIGHANVIDLAITGSFFCVAMGAFYEATAYAARLGMPVEKLVPHALYWADKLRDEIISGATQIESGHYSTDQATVDTYEAALSTVTASIRTVGQPAHLGDGFVANLRAAQAVGHGADALSSIHAALVDNSGGAQ